MQLTTKGVKDSLTKYIEDWKMVYSKEVHRQAKQSLGDLQDDIKQIRLKIDKPVTDIDSLGSVMHALEDIRTKQSNIDFQFKPIKEAYELIENQLADYLDRDEQEQQNNLIKEWNSLVEKAILKRDEIHEE